MDMPAGWYDDGSGRQRWWDGARWADGPRLAHGAGGWQPSAGAPASGPAAARLGLPAPSRPSPVLGFVGLGLAVVGGILAIIPFVFGLGAVVLLAAFVVSLIGLFRTGAAKWPSIVGMVLSVASGAIGLVIVLVASLVLLAPGPGDAGPATTPPSVTSAPPSTTAEPSAPATSASGSRPTPEEIAAAVEAAVQADGITTYDDMPEFWPCYGQFVYESELSDETLRLIVAGQDPPPSDYDLATQVLMDAVLTCDPQ